MNELPKHLSFIMDGNGRWATMRGYPRSAGHVQGYKRMLETIDFCFQKGVEQVSFFAYSTENYAKRDPSETKGIFSLVLDLVDSQLPSYQQKGIRVLFFGNLDRLPEDIKNAALTANRKTADNTKMIVAIALNYGGREDILQASKTAALQNNLQTFPLAPIDLLVRTGGEKRISNFALWLLAYSELAFYDVLWPDVDKDFLEKVVDEYKKRNRRFGGYGE